MLEDLRPLLAQLDPALRQLIPILDFIAPYKRELTSFFANTVAATQATTPGHAAALPAHDQPAQPGEPRRVSAAAAAPTGRTRTRCRALRQARAAACEVYEDRHCSAAAAIIDTPRHATDRCRPRAGSRPAAVPRVPTCGHAERPGLTRTLLDQIQQFAFPASSAVPAPAVQAAGPFEFGGETTQYPHVKAVQPRRPEQLRRVARAGRSAAGRRPGRVLRRRRAAWRRLGRAGAAAGAERRDGHAGRPRLGRVPGDRALPRALRRRRGRRPRARRPADIVLTADLNRLLGLEGCIAGNEPAACRRPAARGRRARAFAAQKPVQVVYGPGTFINASVGEITTQLQRQLGSDAAAQAERAKRGRAQAGAAQGRVQGRAGPARQGGASSSSTRSSRTSCCH